MLDEFSQAAAAGDARRPFAWQFFEPVANAQLGYARYCFSYLSKEPESRGQLIVFDGMSRFRLQDGLIADYAEVFDRGIAFAQLGYEPTWVTKLLGGMRRGGVMVKRFANTWPGADGWAADTGGVSSHEADWGRCALGATGQRLNVTQGVSG